MTNTDGTPDKASDSGLLLRVLTAHFNALVSAHSDEAVLRQYSALLRFLKSTPEGFLEHFAQANRRKAPALDLDERDVQRSSLEDLEKLLNDEATPRRYLEHIAVQRFSVPVGSMRSFSNKQTLVDKLRSLIDNERAHETIGAVARGKPRAGDNE